ncbi:hypothetical protein FPV67DRAFT_1671476 [Lyophyllum atratum]|nr:hypothetical protein FPV67DRAFT_1671476 [Lyophyllum atratum]
MATSAVSVLGESFKCADWRGHERLTLPTFFQLSFNAYKMTDDGAHQPGGKPQMSFKPGELVMDMGSEYVKSAAKEGAKEGGEQTVEYTQTEEGQQHIDDAKAQAEGLWAKYCGCFASAA